MATIIFWTLILSEIGDDGLFMAVIIVISYIPIFIVCSVAILFTIVPLFLFEKKELEYHKMFDKYFPYYSIIVFLTSSYFIITSNFDKSVCVFLITAFFTLMQSWIWICKTPTTEKGKTNWENS